MKGSFRVLAFRRGSCILPEAMAKVNGQTPLQVYLSAEEHAKLRAIADASHRSMSSQVRAWIAEANRPLEAA